MSNNSTLGSELQDLLSPLMDGEPLDLSLLASANLGSNDHVHRNVQEETALAHAAADHLALFEKHIGPYDEILGNAKRHVQNLWRDEVFGSQTGCEPVNPERYAFPKFAMVEGPRPDPCRWLGMFVGRERGDKMKAELVAANEEGDTDDAYMTLTNAIMIEPEKLDVLELTRNVLRYLREESLILCDSKEMLRFCSLYGLNGAIDDVLAGKYGPVNDVTIDSMLSFSEPGTPLEDSAMSFYNFDKMFMQAWSFGVALGYRNVVHHCIHTLGANTDMKLVWRMKETGEFKEMMSLPGLMLYWAIKTNQPDMVKYLATECGFQFRWLSDVMEELFYLLFHIDGMGDEFGVWRSKHYNPDEFMFDRRGQRKYRAKCCYEEKQRMLRAMIEAGLPFELLVPQINLDVERSVIKYMDDNGLVDGAETSELKQFFDSMSLMEKKARNHIYNAGAEFNVIYANDDDDDWGDEKDEEEEQEKEDDTLTLLDFYQRLVDMWKDQPTVQQVRLAEHEELDPRWKQYEGKGDKVFVAWWGHKSKYEDESDYDSEDESDYDSDEDE